MIQNCNIIIRTCGNGFIVDNYSSSNGDCSEQLVFQTMNELIIFVTQQFTHRKKNVLADEKEVACYEKDIK